MCSNSRFTASWRRASVAMETPFKHPLCESSHYLTLRHLKMHICIKPLDSIQPQHGSRNLNTSGKTAALCSCSDFMTAGKGRSSACSDAVTAQESHTQVAAGRVRRLGRKRRTSRRPGTPEEGVKVREDAIASRRPAGNTAEWGQHCRNQQI